ncbi:uncharacterized protein ATNIH1004_003553 [Aspergillus tanneri]|uniref:Uncharacterized protein n=1 Tax=Aspergillus tanneri TaxID=1220188 RepID=A0A5M9MZX4_9EURO|nr:uncharacterized protein ATNIH1004_003553 [Aspergillus tanneri]KAA8650864.1 hypothetical protein ATNIH1004_003553 [Aspergillus tanneri]
MNALIFTAQTTTYKIRSRKLGSSIDKLLIFMARASLFLIPNTNIKFASLSSTAYEKFLIVQTVEDEALSQQMLVRNCFRAVTICFARKLEEKFTIRRRKPEHINNIPKAGLSVRPIVLSIVRNVEFREKFRDDLDVFGEIVFEGF